MALPAGAATAAAAGAAKAAFNYNRGNYQYDEGARRFARYTVGFNMAQAQTKMYREDIEDLTKLTVTKQDTYHTIGTIFFVLNFQLIMAGRLGVHGPSPPGWLLGLYWTNICSALMFLVTFTWMAMHASARAQAGGAFMRTRHVRLPIPTPKQLDKARTTGNQFEKQRLAEMLRIPFVTPAPRDQDPEDPKAHRRMPKWYQSDEVAELHSGVGRGEFSNPEHFEMHRGLHEEWWAYDVYSRIGVLYFMSHWLSSASLYSMCHIFTELRCIWPAWTVTACFVASQYGILQLDIINKPRPGGCNAAIEKYVPLVPFFAVAGMTIDYSVLNPSPLWQNLVYIFAWIGYGLQFAWAWRLYDLARPRYQPQKAEVPGRPWTPAEWPLPPAYEEAVYVVSAPKKVVDSPHCLTQELKHGKTSKQSNGTPMTAAKGDMVDPFAWKLFRGACVSTIAMWSLVIFGRAFEQVNGERMLLKQEGRVERWPSHMQPWMPPWSRFGSRNEYCHAGGCDRRLSESESSEVPRMAHQLVDILRPLAHALETPPSTKARKPEAILPKAEDLLWPDGLQPVHLAVADNLVAAISADRRGAMVKLTEPSPHVTPFAFHGLDGLGEVSGGSFQQTGLMVTMDTGALAECVGLPVEGAWFCQQTGPKLPSYGPSLKAAAASRLGTDHLRAAILLSEADQEDTLLLLETDDERSDWLPVGEVNMPSVREQAHVTLSPTSDAVFISIGAGEVLKWEFGSAEPTEQLPAMTGGLRTKWHAAVPFGRDRIVHLARQPTETAPKLYVRAGGT